LPGTSTKKVLADTMYHATIWTFIEPCIGLVCSCLPVIRGLFPAFKSKNTTKNSASLPIENGSIPPSDSYNSQGQYIKMDDYSWDINKGRSENTQDYPGKIKVNTIGEVFFIA